MAASPIFEIFVVTGQLGPQAGPNMVSYELSAMRISEMDDAMVWRAMQKLREALVIRKALCTNCGCLLEEGKPHQMGGFGYCVLPS